MAKTKHNFSKEELESTYLQAGSFAAAGKVLNVSKVTFRQQYLKSQGKCIVCAGDNDNLTAATCTKCYKLKEYDPDTKQCSKCGKEIQRPEHKSKLAWNKTHVCQECKDEVNAKCIKQAYLRRRPVKLREQKKSQEYKDYQKAYRQSEHGRLRRRISNLRRKCAKVTTCSPNINQHIELLYADPHKKCRYCGTTENLSVEHVLPLSRGGTHSEDNVDLACLPCNVSKGNKTEQEYTEFLTILKE